MRLRALAIAAGLAASAVQAATFTVTNLNDSGAGSLRDAVAQANASAGPDTITFGVTGIITLTSGLMLVTEALAIQGPGAAQLILDGNGASRIFAIIENAAPACPSLTGPADYTVSLSGLTLRNAQRNVANSVGGAIFTAKSLVLDNVTFQNNRARAGGGVFMSMQYPGQSLTVTNSRFNGNQAREVIVGTTGGHVGGAIGVYELCTTARTQPVTVSISDSVFSGNTAQAGVTNARGGAIAFEGDADVTVLRSTFDGNKALPAAGNPNVNAQGGAVSGNSQSLTIRDSTLAHNEAERSSALHLYNDRQVRQTFPERMRVLVSNSTLSGNRSYQHRAVLIFANTEFRFHNSSLVGNRSDQFRNAALFLATGPTVPASAASAIAPTLELESSVLWNAESTADLVKETATIPGPVVVASNHSIVGRICGNDFCGPGTLTLAGAGNQIGVDPLFGALAANGGPTQTRLPQLGSPAIDKGNNLAGLANDQRGAGFPRTLGALTDAGATEFAASAQCEGFGDVAGNDSGCANVAWIKNRGVTQGCAVGLYCPIDPVSRMQMAAFMARLGLPLSGAPVIKAEAAGQIDFLQPKVVCVTDAVAAYAAQRTALLDAVLAGVAGADSLGRITLVHSEDDGVTWINRNFWTPRATFEANQWRSMRAIGRIDIPAGVPVRFGLLVNSPGTAAAGVLDSTCRLRARVENSRGFTLH